MNPRYIYKQNKKGLFDVYLLLTKENIIQYSLFLENFELEESAKFYCVNKNIQQEIKE